MSQENVEIVTLMYEAFGRGDADTALSCIDPSVVTDPRHRVDGRVGQGHAELIAILAEWMDTWDEWSHEIEDIRDAGDVVLVIDVQRGRGRGSALEARLNAFGRLGDQNGASANSGRGSGLR